MNESGTSNVCCKGIFWITDTESAAQNPIFFRTPCDADGNTIYDAAASYTSADGLSFNHRRSWSLLPKAVTGGKPFDYYPRGRVELRGGTAYVFCHPSLCGARLTAWLTEAYHLTAQNGVRRIELKPDFSAHYRCASDGVCPAFGASEGLY